MSDNDLKDINRTLKEIARWLQRIAETLERMAPPKTDEPAISQDTRGGFTFRWGEARILTPEEFREILKRVSSQ